MVILCKQTPGSAPKPGTPNQLSFLPLLHKQPKSMASHPLFGGTPVATQLSRPGFPTTPKYFKPLRNFGLGFVVFCLYSTACGLR